MSELIVHSKQPLNAEPPLDRLPAAYTTAQHNLYIRNHGTIPVLSEEHRLQVGGAVTTPLDLSMAELRERFKARTVTAVMQCAGNRRADMQAVRPVSGDPWAPGAIGNVDWTGAVLADVLKAAGAETQPGMHVVFSALDECKADEESFRYETSIPMEKALRPEVLLAWSVNGEALAPEHGFPIRAVVPGYAGARSPKWLARVTVHDKPSNAKPQARDYKLLPPDMRKETLDWSKGVTINELPVNSAICEPAPLSTLPQGETAIRGYAVASHRGIARVDVSADGGRTWTQAELDHDPAKPWSWTLWEMRLDLPKGEHELVVRAWDTAGQTQPAAPDDTWNFKGYLSAAWHRVRVKLT
jgi:sulfite oxidase